MKLTNDTYFDTENQKKYMSVSQLKSFMSCEARALAEINGEWKPEKTDALLVGSFVDAYFEGKLPEFKFANQSMFNMNGSLKAPFRHAERIIERIERDKLFMEMLSGQKQIIQTGEIEGIPFKIKMDSYHPGNMIVDLKIMRDFEPVYVKEKGRLSFIEAWGYDIQGAVYQYIEGNHLPFLIAAATKEKEPDIGIWQIEQSELDACMEIIRPKIQRYALLKIGIGEPERCEKCDFCKRTKKLTRIMSSEEMNYE